MPAESEHLISASVVTEDQLCPRQLEAMVDHAEAGAVALFKGVVRDHDPEANGEVTGLEYSAHPQATEFLQEVVRKFNTVVHHPDDARKTGLRSVAQHRIGELAVGDVALVVAVSAAHRQEAFAALEDAVNHIKAEVPIWKKQFTADHAHWVGI